MHALISTFTGSRCRRACAVAGPGIDAAAQRHGEPREPGAAGSAVDGRRDFDFLLGQWLVENRRAASPFEQDCGWVSFDTVHECRPVAGSLGHLEEVSGDGLPSIATIRCFDVGRRCWRAHGVSSVDGRMQPPLHGGFCNGVGVLVGDGSVAGVPMLVRETWRFPGSDRPCCERAWSRDGGASWQTWWLMAFSRVHWPH